MRNPLIIGNWKMNLNLEQATDLAAELKARFAAARDSEKTELVKRSVLPQRLGATHEQS